MDKPTFAGYVAIMFNLFDRFMQVRIQSKGRGCHCVYKNKVLIVFFVLMQFRRIFAFKAQHRWLDAHGEYGQQLDLVRVPHRTSLSRRYKQLCPTITAFVEFLGPEALAGQDWYVDKSLFKAKGPLWHQSDRKAGRIPEKLRHLDTEAGWGKRAYQGWVYGYSLHALCNQSAFPKLVQVETGSFSESQMLDQQEEKLLQRLRAHTLTGDNSYTKALRIRHRAKCGVVLLTPALKWVKGRFAQTYHRFIKEPFNQLLLARRRTSVEPLFDLIAKVLGNNENQKQLPVQGQANVRTCLALATLTVQIAMIANSIWGLPLRNSSTMATAFT